MAVRRRVADDSRKVLLEVPAQVAREVQHFLREPRVALDVDLAHEVVLAARQPCQRARTQRNREARLAARREAPALDDGEAQRRQQRRAQLHALAGERREPLARPGLGVEQAVEREHEGRLENGHGNKKGHPRVAP